MLQAYLYLWAMHDCVYDSACNSSSPLDSEWRRLQFEFFRDSNRDILINYVLNDNILLASNLLYLFSFVQFISLPFNQIEFRLYLFREHFLISYFVIYSCELLYIGNIFDSPRVFHTVYRLTIYSIPDKWSFENGIKTNNGILMQ